MNSSHNSQTDLVKIYKLWIRLMTQFINVPIKTSLTAEVRGSSNYFKSSLHYFFKFDACTFSNTPNETEWRTGIYFIFFSCNIDLDDGERKKLRLQMDLCNHRKNLTHWTMFMSHLKDNAEWKRMDISSPSSGRKTCF